MLGDIVPSLHSSPGVRNEISKEENENNLLEKAGLGNATDKQKDQYLHDYYEAEDMRRNGVPEKSIPFPLGNK